MHEIRKGISDVELLDNLSLIDNITVRSNPSFDSNLMIFFNLLSEQSTIDIEFLLYQNLLFDGMNDITVSNNDGLIKFSNETKSVEIKIARYLKQTVLLYNKTYNNKLSYSEKDYEYAHNLYLSHQKNNLLITEYYSGLDILKGYNSENCLSISTLGKSCMMNKQNLLDIYTKNPDKIQLIVIKNHDKIIGRAFLWTLDDGSKFMDRIYTSFDWLGNYFTKIAKDNNYLIEPNNSMKCTIKKYHHEKYPYMDTFKFLSVDDDGKYFLHIEKNIYKSPLRLYRNTNGGFSILRNLVN